MADQDVWDDLVLDTTPALTDRIPKVASTSAAFDSVSIGYALRAFSGTAFPTENLWGGMPFHRTDIGPGLTCFYDATNTQWLTEEHHYSGFVVAVASDTARRTRLPVSSYGVYLPNKNIVCSTYVTTTNTGAAYWTVTITMGNTVFASDTTVHTFTTAADSADAWVAHDAVPDDQTPTAGNSVSVTVAKTGSPGALNVSWGLAYQMIIT